MTWYQNITLLEILFGVLFTVLYVGYLVRVKRVASFFGQRPHTVWLKFILRHLYMILILVAILGPSFGAMKKEIRTIGKDIYIAVDLSQSMNANDVQPSRLEKAKHEIQRLITRFNSDRIGLIVFGNEAYIHSPLTYDQNALQLYTQTLRTNLLPYSGTDYEELLTLVLEKFSNQATTATEEEKAKILVLISDGENFGGEVDELAEQLADFNVRIFTLGIGTIEGGQIPAKGGFKRDAEGEPIITSLQPDPLERLASITKGNYYEINNRSSEVNKLISSINNIEGELRESKTIDVTANKYVYPLVLAFLFILLDILLTVKIIRI